MKDSRPKDPLPGRSPTDIERTIARKMESETELFFDRLELESLISIPRQRRKRKGRPKKAPLPKGR